MWWKTLIGRCIYKSSNGTRVFQNPFFRWLQFDNSDAIQTVLNRYFPYKPGLSYVKPLILSVQLQPASCCMLGLGGGGVAHALSSSLGDFKLTIVESSAEVINIATRFFKIDQLANLHVIHQDASLFVHECKTQFQHLLVDLFHDDAFPSHCNTEEFFADCKRLLKDDGILAVNLANAHEHWPIFQLIKKQFVRSTIALTVPDSTNMIILAKKNESITLTLETLKRSKKFKRLLWDAKWGCIAELRN